MDETKFSSPPLVSIVMITYNHEDYIEKAIEGVLSQKFSFQAEFIISNDNSMDNTHELICNLLDNCPVKENLTIKYFNHSENLGMMNNLVWSFRKASGKYIALIEGDDYWTDEIKLTSQIDLMEDNPNFSFSFHSASSLDMRNNQKRSFYKNKKYESNDTVDPTHFLLKGGGGYATCTAIFKKGILENEYSFIKSFTTGDFPLALLAVKYGQIGYINKNMAVYRMQVPKSWSEENLDLEKMRQTYNSDMAGISKFMIATNDRFKKALDGCIRTKSYQLAYHEIEKESNYWNRFTIVYNSMRKVGFQNTLKLIIWSIIK